MNHQDYYSPDFEVVVNRQVKGIIYSLPEPEYRESLEKAGDYSSLQSALGLFVSGALVNYAITHNISPISANWGVLNINICNYSDPLIHKITKWHKNDVHYFQ